LLRKPTVVKGPLNGSKLDNARNGLRKTESANAREVIPRGNVRNLIEKINRQAV
jgi:hypothetical protein